MISSLKFQHQLVYAQTLGELLVDKIKIWYQSQTLPQLIIPVPLHLKRLRERGFNQALEIARPIAKHFSLPIDARSIKRHKQTEPQSVLPARLRTQNLNNAFSTSALFTGLTIAVIDDVITTGATITAFCKKIKQQGAAHIHVWCCAKQHLVSDIALTAKKL